MAQPLGVQLDKAERRARKAAARVKDLEARLAEAMERAATAEQAAAAQHTSMARQDHVHAEHVAALTGKVDDLSAKMARLIDVWEQVLRRAET